MLKIAITPPDPFTDEARQIAMILDRGWDFVHLRHLGASTRDIKSIIESVPQRLHDRLKLHSHFDLLNEFNLGGIHLNSRCPQPPPLYRGPRSRSCHSVKEAAETASDFDYVTLSPIFDSISKHGYRGDFSHEELMSIPVGKVVALGGITPERIAEISKYPFAGFAMLGYIFDGNDMDSLAQKLDIVDKVSAINI